MIPEKISMSSRTPAWKCVESRADSPCFYYGRFSLSPLMKGQAEIIGIAMRRALLGELEGTCITRAKFEKIPHEYSTIAGIQDSVHEILMNLKEIVLRSNLYGTSKASICVKGPKWVTSQDIILPPSVEIVDKTQHIARLTEPIDFCLGLELERDRGYRRMGPNYFPDSFPDGSYPIDALFMPVRNVNYSILDNGNVNQKDYTLFLEIWTNGSLTPKEALFEASRNLIDLFIPFLYPEAEKRVSLPSFTFHDRLTELSKKKKIAFKSIFIDQLELPSRIYNCLKKSNIHTLLDLRNKNDEDLRKIEDFLIQDENFLIETLENQFGIDWKKRQDEKID
uniref:DNA-directed RNA polymerase subunit alpha n=1 Tax=Pharnaceum aurantium TaxID=2518628 RepID=A0A411L919_9CARY|nr:RNA polymerase alpha subunit [Pharnaceum aurantium]